MAFLAKMKETTNTHAREHNHLNEQATPSDVALRVKALESLLVEKGLVDPAALDALIDAYENKIGPRNGARVVARAWVDPAYKERLLVDATAARRARKQGRFGALTLPSGATRSCPQYASDRSYASSALRARQGRHYRPRPRRAGVC